MNNIPASITPKTKIHCGLGETRKWEGRREALEVGLRVQLVDANLDLQKDLMGLSGIYTHIYI